MSVSKSVKFNGAISTKSIDDERRVIFVASSSNIDRHLESVDVESLRLPLKGGGYAKAGQLPADGIDIVDIPLMLNHSADVTDVIGSVRKAYYSAGELVFEAGISKLEKAQEVLTLIEEGHLGNAFSITMSDFDYDYASSQISNAEVLEVSVVYRGANKDARVIAVKSNEGEPMEIKEKRTFGYDGDMTGYAKSEEVAEAKEAEETEVVETTEEPEAVEAKEPETTEADKTDEVKEEIEEVKKEVKEIKKMVEAKPVQKAKSTGDYFNSDEAMRDFRDVVLSKRAQSYSEIMDKWESTVRAKGITGDVLLPSQIQNIFFKAWRDNDSILSTFRTINAKNMVVSAASTGDTAKGHQKGNKKSEQTVNITSRDIKALAIYKKLTIDMQDLFDDETGELLAFRVEELAARIGNAIAVGAILNKGTGNDATLVGVRGLYPMAEDIKATSGYGVNVATKVTAKEGDNIYQKIVRLVEAVKNAPNGKILVVPDGFVADMLTATNNNGTPLVPFGGSLESILRVKAIYELPELAPSASGDIEAICYADQSYVIVGDNTNSIYTQMDVSTNQNVMLQERFVGGSAQGYKTVAGLVRS